MRCCTLNATGGSGAEAATEAKRGVVPGAQAIVADLSGVARGLAMTMAASRTGDRLTW